MHPINPRVRSRFGIMPPFDLRFQSIITVTPDATVLPVMLRQTKGPAMTPETTRLV
jgi:hypothetical protein